MITIITVCSMRPLPMIVKDKEGDSGCGLWLEGDMNRMKKEKEREFLEGGNDLT